MDNCWVKICGAERISTAGPPFTDAVPFAQALLEVAMDRVLWGTDWPHPNKYKVNPNDGDLVDAFGDWVTDETMRQKIMVATPAALFSF